jgi:hypothetical protein
MRIYSYIREEVIRQGHDVYADEGQLRIAWMSEAWDRAQGYILVGNQCTTSDVRTLGMLVERKVNKEGFRTIPVMIGYNPTPHPNVVQSRLVRLLNQWDDLEPLELYKEFELIHPFVDGNGRVGKILLNWKAGTLDNPFFPPDNLWGEPIRNP